MTAEDEDTATGTATFDITVEDVNERPVVRRRSGTGPFSIVENSGTDVGSFDATDPEGQGVTWSLATSGDHDRFEIDAANGALSFKEAPDYESSDLGLGPDKAYTVTVQATEVDDGEPLTLELTGDLDVTVTITNVNERPVVRRSSGMGAFSIVENSGTDVGSFEATDPEGQGVTSVARDQRRPWPLRDRRGERRAQLQGSARLRKLRPRPRPRQGLHRHRAGYRGGRRRRADARANGRPRRDRHHHQRERAADGRAAQRHGPFSILENSGTDVGSFEATDPEGQGVTWSLATSGDHDRFEIDEANGALSFKEAPDYESSDLGSDKAYTVTVQATEQDDGEPLTRELTGDLDVTVTITNVNERPVVKRRSGMGAFSIVENSGTDVGRFVATDPEGQGVTWSLATSGDHGRFEIDAANGALSFKEAPDYESSDLGLGPDNAYTVTVQATEVDDGDAQTRELTGDLDVTVTITNVNEPPTITGDAAPSVPENTTAVETYVALDPEEVPPSWSLQGGAGVFMITSAGALAFTTAPNYEVEDSYTVTVLASDGTSTTSTSPSPSP